MRKLKHHEQKLLKKVDFLTWKQEENLREIKILRRYHIQDREDYVKCVKKYFTKFLHFFNQFVETRQTK